MGCLDPAILSVRCPCSAEKPLVLVWLPAGRGRNVQRTTAICNAIVYSLAVVPKTMEPRVTVSRRVRCDRRNDYVTVASAHAGCMGRTSCCYRRQLAFASAHQVAASGFVDQRDRRLRHVYDCGI